MVDRIFGFLAIHIIIFVVLITLLITDTIGCRLSIHIVIINGIMNTFSPVYVHGIVIVIALVRITGLIGSDTVDHFGLICMHGFLLLSFSHLFCMCHDPLHPLLCLLCPFLSLPHLHFKL